MSEINIATTEHERNTVVERGETLSLHEQLREADKDREAGKYGVRYPFWATGDQLAAIQEAIEAPWRERVAEQDKAFRQAADIAEGYRKRWVMQCADTIALKARADALRAAAYAVAYVPYGVENPMLNARLTEAVDAYDAADRAGETQDGMDSGGADADRGTADRSDGDGRGLAPSPTDAAAEGEDELAQVNQWCIDLVDIARDDIVKLTNQVNDLRIRLSGVGSKVANHGHEIATLLDKEGVKPKAKKPTEYKKLWDFAMRLKHNHNQLAMSVMPRVADLERWREDVDANRDQVIDEIAQLDARVSLNQLETNTALRELRERLDGLRGPEVTPKPPVVTKAMMEEAAQYLRNVAPETARNSDYGRLQGAFDAALRAGGAKK